MEELELVFLLGEGGGGIKGGIFFFVLVIVGKDLLFWGEVLVIVFGEGLGVCGVGLVVKLFVFLSNLCFLKLNLFGNVFKKCFEVVLIWNINVLIFLIWMIWFFEILLRENFYF